LEWTTWSNLPYILGFFVANGWSELDFMQNTWTGDKELGFLLAYRTAEESLRAPPCVHSGPGSLQGGVGENPYDHRDVRHDRGDRLPHGSSRKGA
jgi:hypothetical protein